MLNFLPPNIILLSVSLHCHFNSMSPEQCNCTHVTNTTPSYHQPCLCTIMSIVLAVPHYVTTYVTGTPSCYQPCNIMSLVVSLPPLCHQRCHCTIMSLTMSFAAPCHQKYHCTILSPLVFLHHHVSNSVMAPSCH